MELQFKILLILNAIGRVKKVPVFSEKGPFWTFLGRKVTSLTFRHSDKER